jgi:hypothetical protein
MEKINLDLRSVALVISAVTLSQIIIRRIPLDKLPVLLANLAIPVLACGITGGLLLHGPADPTILFTGIMFWFLFEANDNLQDGGNRDQDESQSERKKDWWKFWKGWNLYGNPREEETRDDDAHAEQSKND